MKTFIRVLFIVSILLFVFLAIICISVMNEEDWDSYQYDPLKLVTLAVFVSMVCSGFFCIKLKIFQSINWFKIVLAAGIVAICLVSLFPPWHGTYMRYYSSSGKQVKYKQALGHHFIAEQPKTGFLVHADGIDVPRLCVEYIAILIPLAGLLYLLRKTNKRTKQAT